MENTGLWVYFEKSANNDEKSANNDEKRATCKLCLDSYSYATSITNLKTHLRIKHKNICPSTYERSQERRVSGGHRRKTHALWGYFTKVYGEYKAAICNICRTTKSYRTTITNLKIHLKWKHPGDYKRFLRGLPPKFDSINKSAGTADSKSSDNNDDDTQEGSQKLNDVWNYFEQEGTKVRCVVCRQLLVDTSYDNLKAHLFDQHPKLLLQLVQDQDQETKSNVSDEEDNTYTEVVYLEQDSASEETARTSEKPKLISTITQSRPKKRKRINSSSDHPIIKLRKESEPPQKEREEKQEEDSELDTFIKYIRCLLKKLSPDAFSKVQVDILKTIMDAQYSSKITDTKDMSISAPSILTDIASCSVSNVIRVSEIATENSPLVGNYTISLADKGDDLDTTNT